MKQPILKPVPTKNKYILVEDYHVQFDDTEFKIEKGFVFDGASIPVYARAITYSPFHPDVMSAAIVHDYMYRYKPVDRKTADRVFYERLTENGADPLKSDLMYRAVRAFGLFAWKQSW